MPTEQLTCPKCKKTAPLEEFGTREVGGETRIQKWCKECRAVLPQERSAPKDAKSEA